MFKAIQESLLLKKSVGITKESHHSLCAALTRHRTDSKENNAETKLKRLELDGTY